MPRFLAYSAHTGRRPHPCWIIAAPSSAAIAELYPLFADEPIYKMPEERPAWLSDEMLMSVEERSAFRLGETEPRSLMTLVEHLANGDVWEWYVLEEQPSEGNPVTHGELGTFRRFEVGSDVGGLPRKPGRWHVVAIEAAPHPRVAAKLVIAPTIQDSEARVS